MSDLTPTKYFFINRAVLPDNVIKFELMIDDKGKLSKVEKLFDSYEEAAAEGRRQCPK
jgi:hypothetical protein